MSTQAIPGGAAKRASRFGAIFGRTFLKGALWWFGRGEQPLNQKIKTMSAKMTKSLPAPIQAAIAQEIASSRALGQLATARKLGETAPDFTLPDHSGRTHSLAELVSNGPVVIAFLRGGWCPYCNLELRDLARREPEMRALGARIVVLSPERPGQVMSFENVSPVAIPILVDASNAVARSYGVTHQFGTSLRQVNEHFGLDLGEHNGDPCYVLPVPAVYIVDRDRRIRFAHTDGSYMDRVEPEALIAALRGL